MYNMRRIYTNDRRRWCVLIDVGTIIQMAGDQADTSGRLELLLNFAAM